MMTPASSSESRPVRRLDRLARSRPPVTEMFDEADEETCPVICADEIFLGSSSTKNLRVVCYSSSPLGRPLRRKVS